MSRAPSKTAKAPAATELYGALPAGFTRASDFTATSFENQAVSLVDLVRARMAGGEPVIARASFRNCRIEGPGVMLVLACQFEGCDFGNPSGDIRNLILRPAGTAVVGAIAVDACTFTGCQFVGLGYTGPDAFLDQIIAIGTPQ